MKTPPPSSQPKLTVSTVFICFSTVFRNGFQRFSQFSHVWQYIAAYIPCMCHSFHTFDSILQHTSLAYVPHGALDRGYSPPKSEPTKRGSACSIFVMQLLIIPPPLCEHTRLLGTSLSPLECYNLLPRRLHEHAPSFAPRPIGRLSLTYASHWTATYDVVLSRPTNKGVQCIHH